MKHPISRRDLIRLSLLAGVGLGIAQAAESPTRKAIPSSGEKIPVVGLGTNGYSVTDAGELESRRAVLKRMSEAGASVVDTAPAYGDSEKVLGGFLAELAIRERMFLATKITADEGEREPGKAMFEASLERLRTQRLDLLQVHSLKGVDVLMPVLREWKAAKRIRYIGVTTSRGAQHEELLGAMNRHPLDFIQVNYSIGDRAAADKILPLAAERGVAVLLNLPFGGRRGSLFAQTNGKALPAYAAELGIATWGQFFLKYAISHPAVTCAIPGTTKVSHLEDNLGAARGPLPDAALRTKMQETWEALA